jgi:hypothetical protein
VDHRLHDDLRHLSAGRRRPLLNPLKSEEAAFRFLLYVVAAAVVVVAITLLVRAVT